MQELTEAFPEQIEDVKHIKSTEQLLQVDSFEKFTFVQLTYFMAKVIDNKFLRYSNLRDKIDTVRMKYYVPLESHILSKQNEKSNMFYQISAKCLEPYIDNVTLILADYDLHILKIRKGKNSSNNTIAEFLERQLSNLHNQAQPTATNSTKKETTIETIVVPETPTFNEETTNQFVMNSKQTKFKKLLQMFKDKLLFKNVSKFEFVAVIAFIIVAILSIVGRLLFKSSPQAPQLLTNISNGLLYNKTSTITLLISNRLFSILFLSALIFVLIVFLFYYLRKTPEWNEDNYYASEKNFLTQYDEINAGKSNFIKTDRLLSRLSRSSGYNKSFVLQSRSIKRKKKFKPKLELLAKKLAQSLSN